MSPRRSSRARTTQPPPGPQHTHSSSSSNASGQNDRSTRSNNKQSSPQKSTTPHSMSSEEDPEQGPRNDAEGLPQTRRRTRKEDLMTNGDKALDRLPTELEDDEQGNPGEEEEEEEEEEVTRCICGQQEYPGPPVIASPEARAGSKDVDDQNPSKPAGEGLPDESGGLFIQCDICKVWQHGGCIGIMEESMSPDEYYCEQCRRDLHKISVGANGQKYSRYQPVVDPTSVRTPRSNNDLKSPSSRTSRQAASAQPNKRRSTMNSRDAAYDEEEQLRLAIEQSKADGTSTAKDEARLRKAKRGRSDSEENGETSIKRRRTNSQSPSRSNGQQADSDDEEGTSKPAATGARKIRGAAARNQREKALREQREREEAETVRRKSRSDRRRGDDSDDLPISDKYHKTNDGPSSAQRAGTPPSGSQARTNNNASTSRKTGRPPARRGRVGRNQYTKDRDRDTSRARTRSRSRSRDVDSGSANGINGLTNGQHAFSNNHAELMGTNMLNPVSAAAAANAQRSGSVKPSKPKYMNPQRTTMNEMKRRVAGILEFISKTQIELAGERTPPTQAKGKAATASDSMVPSSDGPVADAAERAFNELSSTEMMDRLTRSLLLWQKDHGKLAER